MPTDSPKDYIYHTCGADEITTLGHRRTAPNNTGSVGYSHEENLKIPYFSHESKYFAKSRPESLLKKQPSELKLRHII